MRVKFFMLLACMCVSMASQECLSGTGGSKSMGNPNDFDPYRPPVPQIMGRSASTTVTYVQPERKVNEKFTLDQQPSHNPSPKKALIDSTTSHVSDIQIAKKTLQGEKEEAEDQPETALLPGITTLSDDSEDEKKIVGFHLPPVALIHIGSVDKLYEFIIYSTLSSANHPDVIEVNKLRPLDADALSNGKKWLDYYLKYWGKKCGKMSQAKEIYDITEINTINVDFVKMGIYEEKKRIKVLIKKTDGRVQILGVPDLKNNQ